ncbi:tRNA (N6-isopentenyl adenosine(37)-C2)-methylthiotransferase MiaB [Sodalis sp. CWE]|uniref:tRNA (N6-isopentenyl adenosine(37)-C2)-methylthiotransferase MiaB n=1 Tax=Sodalis sp. CWE TaxID=2803816 RepID=UPI001C7CC6A3|nr:tRNA (N6-isopentenyl adenosine(37)-C2)-methylthiotransferase MiaB [Sodalis sp. CWE]MBX4180934.1 tRNA (N6-isopentenyl adenosine(37)-C2)-methylthiotransferase MiaB [Sodalis sp. CWE]
MNKKLYIKTWGCQMNEYDSSKIVSLLNNTHNYQLTENPEEANILLLNTCSVREKAQEKVFHQLGRWKKLIKKRPEIIIGVGGCVASQEGAYIYERANYVNIIFGPQTLHRLPKMLDQVYQTRNPVIDVSFPKFEKFDFFPKPRATGPTAFVSVMEGCDKYCSFCIIPFTRGEEISRPCEDILSEITQLAKQGVREVTLLGQNVNAYCGTNHDGSLCSFSELIRFVASIDGIDRIRYITSHPTEFTNEIIEVYRDTTELVNFLHLPVQSGSDRILTMMKRSHTVSEYKSIIDRLRKVRPNIHISSDFIVGFPGETKQDFEKTMQFIIDMNFDMSFSFLYSPRPGTPAANMLDDTSEEEKKQRLYMLQERINQQTMQHSRRMQGTTQRILVEGVSRKNIMELFGRTETNRIVNFKGLPTTIGTFVDVKIIDVHSHFLRGLLLKTEDQIKLHENNKCHMSS